jgi:transcriptional regulator with XRE-family HTH domain
MNTFIPRLKELIINSKKQQKEICQEMHITKQKLTNWKTGYTEPNLDDLILIATYFNVSIDFLLGLEDETGAKTTNNTYNNYGNHNGNVNF